MLALIADAGSTKIDWVLLQDQQAVFSLSSQGFNPHSHPTAEFGMILRSLGAGIRPWGQPDQVHYYGAGCSAEESRQLALEQLLDHFPAAQIAVESDMLGSARALCGKAPGIACILGTGSNSCSFDGVSIVDQIPNLGFVAGDDGSGAWIGREVLRAYFYRQMPESIAQSVREKLPGGREALLQRIKENQGLNTWMAEFSSILATHIDEPFSRELIRRSFGAFLRHCVEPYEGARQLPLHFSGSIAFHYSGILRDLLQERGFITGKIIKQPMEGLISYHTHQSIESWHKTSNA